MGEEGQTRGVTAPLSTPELPVGCDYDVFLSFRGPDTRRGFTDYLYTYLVDKGFQTFRDEKKLEKGQPIDQNLIEVIRMSRISIAILSKDYASSQWCLNELVQMVKCKTKRGHEVIPIFYDITPSEVRNQTGSFEVAFCRHEESGTPPEEVKEWRAALTKVSNFSGWEREKTANGMEGELVKEVVKDVEVRLKKHNKLMPTHLVGMERHLTQIEKLLNVNANNEALIIGIQGMCGIGKTTISKAIYNKFWKDYKHHSFMENIRERKSRGGLLELQRKLIKEALNRNSVEDTITSDDAGRETISNDFRKRKVFIVLDGVETLADLDEFAKERKWFGPGSKIIVTTRNKAILVQRSIPFYEPSEMGEEESEKLLSNHAFDLDKPPDDFSDLCKKLVDIASGLPLFLTIIGNHLSGMTRPIWEGTCEKLEKIPDEDVRKHLEECYTKLNKQQKHIFLDIACFLIGVDQRVASHMWSACDLYPKKELLQLTSSSLVKIGDNNVLDMHRQLRDVGREIVRLGPLGNDDIAAKGSRLWSHREALRTLRNINQKKKEVSALCLDFGYPSNGHCFKDRTFEKLCTLTYLQLDCAELEGDFQRQLCSLRWLRWKILPVKFTFSNFSPEELVILDLSNSNITEDWGGWIQLKVAKELKVLNLTACGKLTATPDVSGFEKLERLILEDCTSLVRIDSSIVCLRELIYLNIKNCAKLKTLPDDLRSREALEIDPSCWNRYISYMDSAAYH